MNEPVPRRVHIAPQGFEDERIYRPAIDRDADIVVLIDHDSDSETASRCREQIIKMLEEEGISVDRTDCDIFDLNDSIETILAQIRQRNTDDNIRVNISAGSKITAIAGMLACMFTSAEPYYVVPEGYTEARDDRSGETVSFGMDAIEPIPAYPATEPDLQLIQVLSFIQEEQPDDEPYGVLLKQIGRFLLEEDLPAVQGSDKSPDDAEDIYPMVNEEIVEPLSKRNLIHRTRLDGGMHVRTSKEGDEMLSLAESLLRQHD